VSLHECPRCGKEVATSLAYDDDVVAFGGVQFNWGEAA